MKCIYTIILLAILITVSCSKPINLPPSSQVMSLHQCTFPDAGVKQFKICFDSLLTDSRCPRGVQCIWQGVAIAKFSYTYNDQKGIFSLATNKIMKDTHTDTLIAGYRISLKDISPYPEATGTSKPVTVEVNVTKE